MLIQLALTAIGLALLALAVVWTSNDANKYRKLAWVTLFLTFDLVLFGAFTRLTDSGLGCPDWPGCYGHTSPVGAAAPIAAAERAVPTGAVTHAKAWIEMTHRYLATGVGALIVVLRMLGLGAWRISGYAVAACPHSPPCQGGSWPHMDRPERSALLRELGRSAGAGHLPFPALPGLHVAHRLGAVLLLAALAALILAL